MTGRRRSGSETSATRARLLDVTEQVMLADGYAAVTSRRVAKEAGVTAALVHYYFATIDDLFVAVLRRRVEQQLERQQRVLSTTDRPLHALWEMSKDPTRTGLTLEFTSLAHHRKSVRNEIGASAERFRQQQFELLRPHIERCIGPGSVPPMVVLWLVVALGQNLVLEESIDVRLGHVEAAAVVERYLDEIEPHPRPRDDTDTGTGTGTGE